MGKWEQVGVHNFEIFGVFAIGAGSTLAPANHIVHLRMQSATPEYT
jgi:hypothetical protein